MEDTIDVASKLQRFMKEQLEEFKQQLSLQEALTIWKTIGYILGQIRTYEFLLQEISNLLNKKELNADAKGNVIKLD
jgi:hypothetical protein